MIFRRYSEDASLYRFRRSQAYAAGLADGKNRACERPARSDVVAKWYGNHGFADAYFAGFDLRRS